MAETGEPKPILTISPSPYTRVRQEIYDFGHGPTIREVVERPDAVVILAINAEGKIYFVKQHRYGAGKVLLELPAGKIDKDAEGDTPLKKAFFTAHKELQEEIGFKAMTTRHLGGFYASPGYSTEYLYAFEALDLVASKLEGDEDDIEIVTLSYKKAMRYVQRGKIEDSKSIATLALYAGSL